MRDDYDVPTYATKEQSSIKDVLQEVEAKLKTVLSRCDELEEVTIDLDSKIDDLEDKVEDLENQLDELKDNLRNV